MFYNPFFAKISVNESYCIFEIHLTDLLNRNENKAVNPDGMAYLFPEILGNR